jgi:hypothetical protein
MMHDDTMDQSDDEVEVRRARNEVPVFSPGGDASANGGSATWRASGFREPSVPASARAESVASFSQFSQAPEDGDDADAHIGHHPPPSVAPSQGARSDGTFQNRRPSELAPTMVGRPGFDEKHYGRGVTSRPLIHPSESPLEWEEYSDALCTDGEGVFKPMKPSRSMNVNVPASFLTKGAVKASDFITPKDVGERRRVEGSAMMLGIFNAAASKGYANGDHAQLEPFAGLEPKEFEKKKHDLEPFKSYVYTLQDENDPDAPGYRAQMFSYACEAVYDPEGKHIIAFRYWKFVNHKGYSDSYAWKKILEENSELAQCSRMNRSSRYKRSTRTLQDSRAARSMTKAPDTAETGESLYLNLTNVSDLRMLYKTYAGTTEDSLGAPVFDESLLPAGLTTHELYEDKDEQLGGLHPLGPETALNARRLPGPGGQCPLTAGMVDLHGNLLIGHPSQMHPDQYFNADDELVLPQFVQEKGAFKIMVNPYQTSIFDADLPHPTCGSEEPDDNILILFWEQQKTANSILVTARKHARTRGLDCEDWRNFREEIFRAIGQQMSERDGLSKELCRAMQQSKLCGKVAPVYSNPHNHTNHARLLPCCARTRST